jgi:transcriptional regulator with GAF, ATPase, and Fis domain
VSQIRVKLGQGVAGFVAERGEPVNMPDPRGESRFFADIDRLTGYRTSTILAVPLRDASGTLYGVLQVLNRRGGGRFTDDDVERLMAIAVQVSHALQSTSLYQELQRAKEQPHAPVGYFFNRIIGESEPLKVIWHFVAASAKRHRLPMPRLSAAALERLKRYRWPGNVRELENCIESAVVLSEGEILEEHLPLPKVVGTPPPASANEVVVAELTGDLLPLAEVEKRHILRVLDSVKSAATPWAAS